MGLSVLNILKRSARAFLPDRGNESIINSDTILLEYGRLVVLKTPSGKIRLKIGAGDKTPANLNYIGEAIITRSDPTTVAFGDLPAGSVLQGKGWDEVVDDALYSYQEVKLNSITINQPNVELGQPFNSTILLTCNIANVGNIAPGASAIVSSSPQIFTPQTFNPTSQYIITGVSGSFSTITDVIITVQIVGLQSETDQASRTVQVSPKIWTGSSALQQITTYTQLKALGTSKLARTRQGDYNFTNNYSHFGIPSQINVAGIGFVDIDINTGEELLTYDTTPMPDLIVTNDYGVQVTHKMWRSTYPFGGQTKARIK